jgi:hypothetical protein
MQYKYAEIADTVYFWFAANDVDGNAGDGATPLYDVRLAGAAANAAPVASGTPTLLSHANYSDGLFEIAIDTTGYAAGEYAVFCTLTISTVNPAGFCGSFKLRTAGTGAVMMTVPDTQKVDVNTFKTKAITCANAITVLANVGFAGVPGAENGSPTVAAGAAKISQTVDLTAGQSIACSDKTGFSLSATGADLILHGATFMVAMATAVWELATRVLTAGTNIVLAKGTGVTGFNDVSAADVNAACDTAISDATLATATNLAVVAGYIDTEIGTIDTVVDAIKVQTDKLVFTVTGEVDANIQSVNNVALQGVGLVSNPWGPV